MNTTAYDIENEPLPEVSTNGRGRPALYPFKELKRGQCFKVPGGNASSLSGLAQYHGKKTGRSFSVRKLDGGVVGVWRVK